MKKVIAVSLLTKNSVLDDDYTLYEDGEVLHEYDRHSAPGGQNLKETLSAIDLEPVVKERLLAAATDENKELAKRLLGIVG